MRGTSVLGEHPSPSHNISHVTLTFNENKHSLDSTLKSAINAFHTKREKDEKENRTFPFRHRINTNRVPICDLPYLSAIIHPTKTHMLPDI